MLEFLQLPRIIDLQATPGFERWALADNAGRRPFLLGLFRGQPTKVAFLEENHGLTLPVLTANG
jgi:hypothetical protein